MATTTVSGSTVTFSNSGAAANLRTQTSEDSLLAFDISTVLAASGGGKNTTIYSVDDGAVDDNSLVTTNNAFKTYDTDLLYKDASVAAWNSAEISVIRVRMSGSALTRRSIMTRAISDFKSRRSVKATFH